MEYENTDFNKQITTASLKKEKDKCYYKNIDNMLEFIKDSEIENNFNLIEFKGIGSEGVCYHSFHKNTENSESLLKFIFEKDLNKIRNIKIKEKLKQKQKKEIELHSKLKQKNITCLYNTYNINNHICLEMQYADYGDLNDFLKKSLNKKYGSQTFLCYVSYQTLKGLEYLHNNKIVHMDIKEKNILINSDLKIQITDFSISKDYSKFKNDAIVLLPKCGTTCYIAPEILNGNEIKVKNINKIDIYGLGVMLYKMAFGKFPYDILSLNNKDFNTIYKIIQENKLVIPELKCYSKLFNNFLEKLLEKDIEKRYSIQDALNDPFIKGINYILENKKKIGNLEKFLINLVTDNIPDFEYYINPQDIKNENNKINSLKIKHNDSIKSLSSSNETKQTLKDDVLL